MTEQRLNLPFPEAGEGAIMAFTMADLLGLEEENFPGCGSNHEIFRSLAALRIKVILKLVELGTKGGDFKQAIRIMPLEDVASRIGDAIALRYHGKTLDAYLKTMDRR